MAKKGIFIEKSAALGTFPFLPYDVFIPYLKIQN